MVHKKKSTKGLWTRLSQESQAQHLTLDKAIAITQTAVPKGSLSGWNRVPVAWMSPKLGLNEK